MSETPTVGSFVVRRARPDELDAAGALTLAAYGPFVHDDNDQYRVRLRDAVSRDRDAEVWVAVEAGDGGSDGGIATGTLLGTVTLCPAGSPWREIARPGEAEFRMLAVDPGARRRGVGRALVDLVTERARADGDVRVVLSSLPAMTDAHRLYEGRGYVRAPDRDWAPFPHVPLIAYTQEL